MDFDDYLIHKIFKILYEDNDIESIWNLKRISKKYYQIGEIYEKKYIEREEDWNDIYFENFEQENEKYWNEQAEWLRNEMEKFV
jgi:hypothetical protein